MATGLALLALVLAVHRLEPDRDQELRPLAVEGERGRPVDAGAFTIEVQRVTTARTVISRSGLGGVQPLTTGGTWVLVWATATARREPLELLGSYLVTRDGHRYAATERLGGVGRTLDGTTLEPGIARHGAIVFEVPHRRLAGARLSVSDQPPPNRLGYEARIALGIDDRRAATLVSEAPALVELAEVSYR